MELRDLKTETNIGVDTLDFLPRVVHPWATNEKEKTERADLEVLRIMQMNGLDLTRKDKTFSTVFHRATIRNYPEITKYLISIGYDVNCVDGYGKTPLHYCDWKSMKCAKILLENNANPNAQDNCGNTLYQHTLAYYEYKEKPGSLLSFLRLLHKFKANPNLQNDVGETALHLYFRAMLQRVKTEELDFMHGRVHIEVADLEFMLSHGADPNIKDEFERTPVHYLVLALQSKCTDTFDLLLSLLTKLLQYGASLESRNIPGTPVLHTLMNGYLLHPELFDAKLLLEIFRPKYKVNLNVQDFYNRTALHLVSAKGDWKLAEIILMHGGNMEMLDCDGNTALDVTIICKQWDHARKLLLWPFIVAKRSNVKRSRATGSNTTDDHNNYKKCNSSSDNLLFQSLTEVNVFYSEFSTALIKNTITTTSNGHNCNNSQHINSSKSGDNENDKTSGSSENDVFCVLKNLQRTNTTSSKAGQRTSPSVIPSRSCLKWTDNKLDAIVRFVAYNKDAFYFTRGIILPNLSKSAKSERQRMGAKQINKFSLWRLCEENSFEFHLTECREEHCLVAQQVFRLVKDLLQKCSEMDPRMKSELHWTGSSSEGTKMWLPDEFDFVMELVQLKGCCSVNDLSGSGSQSLFLNGKCRNQWSNLCFGNTGALYPELLKNYISVLLWKAAFELDRQKYPNMVFNLCNYSKDSNFFTKETKVGINLSVRWDGEMYKNLTVSIDVTPAVPVEISLEQLFVLQQRASVGISDTCVHFVPYLEPSKGGWRPSFSLLEVRIMSSLTRKQISLYKCLKLLRDVFGDEFQQIPSYYLKTFFLRFLFNDPYEFNQTMIECAHFHSCAFHILHILKKIDKYPRGRRKIQHLFLDDTLCLDFCSIRWCKLSLDHFQSN